MPSPIRRQDVTAARRDIGVFARVLVGEALWDHQLAAARSEARITCLCSGRQAGKSRLLAIQALHRAFASAEQRVLVVSAGDSAAKAILAEVVRLSSSPLLAGSVADESASVVTLSNGSTIRSVPASTRQIRGQSVDLLVIDEACFVDAEIWEAARWTMIARPGSRVVVASTPWGRQDGWFAMAYRLGLRREAEHESFHWPSTASPLVDSVLLDIWRQSSSDREYRREVLAEWVDDHGAFFAGDELEAAVTDYELVRPEVAAGRIVTGGVDWGFARDSSALVMLAMARDGDLPGVWPSRTFWLPWVDEGVGVPYASFVRRVADAVGPGRYRATVATEVNGVGAMPSSELRRLTRGTGCQVLDVTTTAASKAEGFGRMRLLLQQGRLALPRLPVLLGQLSALSYEERDSGSVHIAVPEAGGLHDDVAMAACLAIGAADVASVSTPATTHVARGPLPKVSRGQSARTTPGDIHVGGRVIPARYAYAYRPPEPR